MLSKYRKKNLCKICFFFVFQEQLRHKVKFNLISFSSKVCPWRDRLVEVNEQNLQSAWGWVKSLTCNGSTNTLGALKFALNDPATQAIYMLSDGRPDQVKFHPDIAQRDVPRYKNAR